MSPSSRLANTIVDELVRCGVRELVLAPGSRSAALALAAHRAEAEGRLRLHVRVDERTAGYLALGLARGGGSPAAVLTTSGTAVGNLLPAVMESSHAGVPLVVLTADRPAELRGTGANQTTEQVGIFGRFPRFASDALRPRDLPRPTQPDGSPAVGDEVRRVVATAVAAATGAAGGFPGPAHLNVQFVEPLLPAADEDWPAGRPQGRPWVEVQRGVAADPVTLPEGPRTVVLAGDDAGPPARLLAESAGWPLLAEPTSGARTGDHAVRCYRLLLGGELARQVERVVVYGHPTLSRPVNRLLARTDVEVVAVSRTGAAWPDAGHVVSRVIRAARPAAPAGPDWLTAWREADRAASAHVDRVVTAAVETRAGDSGLPPHAVAQVVHQALPAGGLLVVGSSSPVRDLDLMAVPTAVGERRKTVANRGLSGIDGTVSTAVGAALARPHSSRAIGYLGDLAFLHDANGLLIGPLESRPDLTLVVANDDGGSIFATLEQGAPRYADSFERVFGTPTGADLGDWCRAVGVPHRRVADLAGLQAALTERQPGIDVVEVPVDRSGRRLLEEQLNRFQLDQP